MKNTTQWIPTKILSTRNGYVINSDFVSKSSLIIATLQVESYIPLIKRHAKGGLLDCGCMKVPFYEVYHDIVSEIYCIDITPNEHLDLVADLNEPLPLESDSFDTILFTDVLQYITKPDQLFFEFSRLLRPGGKLILTIPFLYNIHDAPSDLQRFTEFALRKKCEEANMKVIELDIYGGLPDVFFDLLNKSKFSGPVFIKFFNWVRKTKKYQRLRELNDRKFPLGYNLVAEKI